MDEPPLGLSPLMVRRVARIIKGISLEGINVLQVGQNARLVLKLAQYAYVHEKTKFQWREQGSFM
jgi:branched-chain amino acid transport system ATP-binding protein